MSNKQTLVDVINLNAEASCLSTKRWLKALRGGKESELHKLLDAYVAHDLKINLGIVGSTLAEIEYLNPECITLINSHPQNFEILIRPFIHSLSILWSNDTFSYNYKLGKTYIESKLENCINWYLPPEFAMRNSHVYSLSRLDCKGTFIHPKRVKSDLKSSLPTGPFTLASIQDIEMPCVNFTEDYDTYYLDQLQVFKSSITFDETVVYGWRDGESPFFLPNSVQREEQFIINSSDSFDRIFLSEALSQTEKTTKTTIHSYPQNSLLPWLRNFRLFWFTSEIKAIEQSFNQLSKTKQILFLNLLNSDILSSIEKNDVTIELKQLGEKQNTAPYLIKRKERNLDAENILFIFNNFDDLQIEQYIENSDSQFFTKIKARYKAAMLAGNSSTS
jgi:hypothetical protein